MTMSSQGVKNLIKKSTGTVTTLLFGFCYGFSVLCSANPASNPNNNLAVITTPSDPHAAKPADTAPPHVTTTLPTANAATPSASAPSTTTGSTSTTSTTLPSPKATASSMPLNQPNMKNDDILNFAKNVAKAVYSYDFKNYKNQLPMTQIYFTNPGWKAFNDALTRSNNLKTVEDKKLVASATIIGNPTLLEQGVKNGRYTWKIHVPLLATYENEARLIKQNLSITMLVSRTNTGQGVGVSHFIAEMVPPSTQTQSAPSNTMNPVNATTNKPITQTDVPTPMAKTPSQTQGPQAPVPLQNNKIPPTTTGGTTIPATPATSY